MAYKIISNHVNTLNNQVLMPLDEMASDLSAGRDASLENFQIIQARFYQVAVYNIDWQDYFGLVPVYFINPDMKYLMNADLLAIIETVGGTG